MEQQDIDTPELSTLRCFASMWTSRDLSGPRVKIRELEETVPRAARMKYLLVAKFTIPKSYVTGEFEPTGENPQEDGSV